MGPLGIKESWGTPFTPPPKKKKKTSGTPLTALNPQSFTFSPLSSPKKALEATYTETASEAPSVPQRPVSQAGEHCRHSALELWQRQTAPSHKKRRCIIIIPASWERAQVKGFFRSSALAKGILLQSRHTERFPFDDEDMTGDNQRVSREENKDIGRSHDFQYQEGSTGGPGSQRKCKLYQLTP